MEGVIRLKVLYVRDKIPGSGFFRAPFVCAERGHAKLTARGGSNGAIDVK